MFIQVLVELCKPFHNIDLLLFTYMFSFLYHCQDFYRTWLYICVTRWVSYKKRNCLPFASTWLHPQVLVRSVFFVCLLFVFGFLCCHSMCLYILSSMLWCSLRFPQKNDVRFVFVWRIMSYLRYLCFLRVVVSDTYYFGFRGGCIPFVVSFFLIVHFWLSIRYSLTIIKTQMYAFPKIL